MSGLNSSRAGNGHIPGPGTPGAEKVPLCCDCAFHASRL